MAESHKPPLGQKRRVTAAAFLEQQAKHRSAPPPLARKHRTPTLTKAAGRCASVYLEVTPSGKEMALTGWERGPEGGVRPGAKNQRFPSTPRSGALYQGPTSVGPQRIEKDWALAPATRRGRRKSAGAKAQILVGPQRPDLKSGPDTKQRFLCSLTTEPIRSDPRPPGRSR